MKNLLELDDYEFSALIKGDYTHGIISVMDNCVYLCQNVREGSLCGDTKGYKYSWNVEEGTHLEEYDVVCFEVIPKDITLDNGKVLEDPFSLEFYTLVTKETIITLLKLFPNCGIQKELSYFHSETAYEKELYIGRVLDGNHLFFTIDEQSLFTNNYQLGEDELFDQSEVISCCEDFLSELPEVVISESLPVVASQNLTSNSFSSISSPVTKQKKLFKF